MKTNVAKLLKKRLTKREMEAVCEFIEEITRKYGGEIEFVRLYGSRARGEGGEGSDIDLLICVEGWDRRYLDELSDLSFDYLLKYDVLLSPIIYSEVEWISETKARTPFIKNIEREGIDLWEREKLLSKKRSN